WICGNDCQIAGQAAGGKRSGVVLIENWRGQVSDLVEFILHGAEVGRDILAYIQRAGLVSEGEELHSRGSGRRENKGPRNRNADLGSACAPGVSANAVDDDE